MAKVEKGFYKLVDIPMAAKKIDLNEELVDIISKYWMLKRIAGGNKPLLPPRGDDETLSALRGEDTERDKMKMLVTIRQDLERVRNLACMVSRREKLSRSFVKITALLQALGCDFTRRACYLCIELNHDRFSSLFHTSDRKLTIL